MNKKIKYILGALVLALGVLTQSNLIAGNVIESEIVGNSKGTLPVKPRENVRSWGNWFGLLS